MAEYIDKHEAYTLLKDLEAAYIYPPVREAYGTAARRIDQIKPADVQPVRRGKWIGDEVIQCSICTFTLNGNAFERIVRKYFKYCPNCGARMDGDTNG